MFREKGFLSLVFTSIACASLALVKYFENDPAFALFGWFAIAAGVYVIVNFLELKGTFLDKRIILPTLVLVTLGGGVLANVYIFISRSTFPIRVFSLTALLLIVAAYGLGITAYLLGKKNLAEKIVNWLLNRRASN